MGWFAWLGVIMPVVFGLNGWVQQVVLSWTGWTLLWVSGLAGTVAIGLDSARNLARFATVGLARPRFYFELARLQLALIFLLVVPAVTPAFFPPNLNLPELPVPGFLRFRVLVEALVVTFCLSAMLGYLVSFGTRRMRRGRAYECTSFFFCIFGGLALVAYGYLAIGNPPQGLSAWLLGAGAGGLGLVLLTAGLLSEMGRAKRVGSRQALKPAAGAPHPRSR